MAQDSHVRDKDTGYRKALASLARAEGLTVRIGWLSGAPKYSKARGGTAIARVAGVMYGLASLVKVWDKGRSKFDADVNAMHRALLKGGNPETEAERMGERLADEIKKEVEDFPLVNKGVLKGEIKYRLGRTKAYRENNP